MNSDSDNESTIEGDVDVKERGAEWGKAKYDYYYTDYVDKDYPNKLSVKEERLAAQEQEEALRIQKKLLSTLDNAIDLETVVDTEHDDNSSQVDLIDLIETQNKNLLSLESVDDDIKSKKRKRVQFEEPMGIDECEFDDEDDEEDDNSVDEDDDEQEGGNAVGKSHKDDQGRQRRPINVAIKKNRGLTPYKKKEYRNPRVKHKLKFKKAMSKRRRMVKEVQNEFYRYTGEATGIKTSTVRSVKLC